LGILKADVELLLVGEISTHNYPPLCPAWGDVNATTTVPEPVPVLDLAQGKTSRRQGCSSKKRAVKTVRILAGIS